MFLLIITIAWLTLLLISFPLGARGFGGRFLDEPQQIRSASLEVFVPVDAGVLDFLLGRLHGVGVETHFLVEAVHVKLSDK